MRVRYGSLVFVSLLLSGCGVQSGAAPAASLSVTPSKASLHIVHRISARMPLSAPPQGNIVSLSMVSNLVGFAVAEPASGGSGQFLYTSDGGQTWHLRAHVASQVTALQFVTPTVGFALTPGGLLATTDGGRTWTPRALEPFSQVRFVSPLDGVAITQLGALVTTTDGGASWTMQLAAPGRTFSSVSALAGPVYYALASTQAQGQQTVGLYVSHDGGSEWSPVFDGIAAPPLHQAYEAYLKALLPSGLQEYPTFGQGGSVTFTTPMDGWVSLFDGGFLSTMVLHTSDGGRTWTYAWGNGGCAMGCNGSGGGLYPAAFLGSQYAWRYDGQAIDRSADSGETFAQGGAVPLAIPPSQGVHSLQFMTPEDGVAATSYGIIRTSDGGRSWKRVWPFGPGPLQSVSMTPSGFGFAVATNAPDLLLRTRDGGKAWQPLRGFPTPGLEGMPRITAIWAFPGGRGLVYAGSTLYRTKDSGRTWQQAELAKPPGAPYSQVELLFRNLQDGWALSLGLPGNELYRTTDGGHTWTKAAGLQMGPTSCQEVSASIGWCLNGKKDPQVPPQSWTSKLLVTTDDGRKFTEVASLPMVSSATSLSFATPSAGTLLGANDLWMTRDAGRTFTQVRMPGIDFLSQVDAVTEEELYVLAGDGQLFVTHDGGKDWEQLL